MVRGRGWVGRSICVQGPDDGMFQRPDCTVAPPGGAAVCDTARDPLTGEAAVRSEEIDIWAPDGSEATIHCRRPPVLACDPFIQTYGGASGLPDACLFSASTWSALRDVDTFGRAICFPWAPAGCLPTDISAFELCGALGDENCPTPSGRPRAAATTRALWCGGSATDTGDYACDYLAAPYPDPPLSETTTSHLGSYECPKNRPLDPMAPVGPLLARRDFFVEGDPTDVRVASRNAGALGGAYCNMLGDRSQLGRLPPETYRIQRNHPIGRPDVDFPVAAYTVYAVRDIACEEQVPNDGRAEPTLDPGVAQGGQSATVLAGDCDSSTGSRVVMVRDEGVGPASCMPVDGQAEIFFGPDGGVALTDFRLQQANEVVPYTDSSGTYAASDGRLVLGDMWMGTYTPGISPSIRLTSATAHAIMSFQFDGRPFTLPLRPDMDPAGDFDGVDRLTLTAHFRDEPDQADFTLTLEMAVQPRPLAVIDSVTFDSECRRLPSGLIGTTLEATGLADAGSTTLWRLTQPDPTMEGGSVRYTSGTSATFALPLGAPGEPPYSLAFTAIADGQVNRDTRTGFVVEDRTPPEFESLEITPSCLWPPDHRYARFRLGEELLVSVVDECSPEVRVRIANVVSNQADNARGTGDGDTTDDVIFGDTGFCIRAERDGRGMRSRLYTVALETTDTWGNVGTREVVVEVPHDQSEHCPGTPSDIVVDDAEASRGCVFATVPPLDPPASIASHQPTVAPSGRTVGVGLSGCAVEPVGSSSRNSRCLFLLALMGGVFLRRRKTVSYS